MFGTIWCLSLSNFSMFPELRDELFRAACNMIMNKPEKGSWRRKIRGDEFEGVVCTQFRQGYLGSVCGYVFTAELDLGGLREKGKVTYLIREADAEYWLQAVEEGTIHTSQTRYHGPGIQYGNPPAN